MGAIAGLMLCGTYCAGLFIVSLLVRHLGLNPWPGAILTGVLCLGLGAFSAVTVPRWWRTGPPPQIILIAGLVGCLAALNYGWRYPSPGPLDVSYLLNRGEAAGTQQEVWGWVQDFPRLTRSGKGQFWLKTEQIRAFQDGNVPLGSPESVTGKLYVTLPADEAADIFPGQLVKVEGRLYRPNGPKNPNAFDFRQYLADHHSFAGFSGQWVNREADSLRSRWGLWRLRRRIAHAHASGLGPTAGPLISAMSLGRRAVNVPYEIQDAFIQAGLAHTLAASGFHVSLVLGVVLAIVSRPAIAGQFSNPALSQLIVGGIALATYVVLTGGQPSVLRAALMGTGALVGLALERQVKPLGCLLLVVTLLLLWNPTWVDDIGFRLSATATLGLIVSVKPLTRWLEWLPATLATIIAVPVAAYFWTIPLSLYYFNTLTTYSVALNMVATPLVMVLSLGGIFSGVVAVVSPGIGAILAWVLWLPAHMLIWLVNWEVSLPSSSVATGHIALWQMLGLYGFYGLAWAHPWWRQRRWLVGILLLAVAMGPIWYRSANRAEITVLAAGNDAVMVVQDHRSSLLVNSGTAQTGFYTVAPFLRQAGINRLTSAVAWDDSDQTSWQVITAKTPVHDFWGTDKQTDDLVNLRNFHRLIPEQPALMGGQMVEQLDPGGTALSLTLLGDHRWLKITEDINPEWLTHPALNSDVLWWDGHALSEAFIETVGPEVAIASARFIDSATEQYLLDRGIRVFCTERDGAITWNQSQGYRAFLHQPQRSMASVE